MYNECINKLQLINKLSINNKKINIIFIFKFERILSIYIKKNIKLSILTGTKCNTTSTILMFTFLLNIFTIRLVLFLNFILK